MILKNAVVVILILAAMPAQDGWRIAGVVRNQDGTCIEETVVKVIT